MRIFIRKKGLAILYFVLLGLTFFFFFLAGRSGEDYQFKLHNEINFATPWTYTFSNGTSGTTELPAQLDGGDSETLVLTNVLPEILDETTFFYRSRHMDVKIFVDGVCVYQEGESESTGYFPLPGNYWIEVELGHDDSGKEIKLELNGKVTHYLDGPGSAYLGGRADFLMKIQNDNIGTIVGASVLLILSVILLILWIMLYVITKEPYNECLCLAFFTLSIALWGYTETRCLQFVFPNMRQFSVFAFEILAIAPVPIALYFTYSKREKTRQQAQIAAAIPMMVWLLNNLLHFLHIKDIAETLKMTQIMIVIDAIFIAYIQVSDIYYHLKHEIGNERKRYWRVPLYGLLALIPLLMIDMSKYIMSNIYYVNQANLTCIGVVIYIICLACHSALRLVAENSTATSANEAKTQFLANMSHEIRTPLNAILGFDEMILRNTTDPRILEYASDIQSSGENLLEIINKILDLSKIEAGKMEIINVSYSTVQMLDNVVSMISPLAEKKKLYFKLEIDSNLPEQLVGDETHIRQVLINLMTNAVKYTRDGGVTFKVQVIEAAEKDEICKVLYSVKDTGIGIKEEDKERLFVKFERLDSHKNKNIEGTGLGMNIVAKLLGAMGSRIKIDSIYGQGSEFSFVLKQRVTETVCVGDYEAGRQHRTIENQRKQSYTAPDAQILIVDDVKVNLKVACGLLKPLKIQVDTADSGFEAVQMAEKKRYDVILMDHMMPDMNGIETTKCIRQLCDKTGDTYYCKLPVIALTANVMSGMYEKYIEEGMQDFISKPIDEKQLEDILLKWLPKDKIIYNTSDELSQDTEEENVKETGADWGIDISGIDILAAKQYYSDKESFEDCLRDYVNSIPTTIEKLEIFCKNQDKENYTITVHGLKSGSRVVGAVEVSEAAKQLEDYCHNGDYENAWNGTDELLEMLTKCADCIREYFKTSDDECTCILSEEEMQNSLSKLKDIAENFDMQGLMDWEKSFSCAHVPADYAEDWLNIIEAVRNVAFLDIVSEIELFAKHKFNE